MVPSHRAVSRFLSLRCITTAGSPHFHRPSRRPPPHAPICVGRTSVARCLLAVKHGRVRSPILAGTQVRSEDSSTASRSRHPSPPSNQASTPPERERWRVVGGWRWRGRCQIRKMRPLPHLARALFSTADGGRGEAREECRRGSFFHPALAALAPASALPRHRRELHDLFLLYRSTSQTLERR
jgi:hypothetical protein